MSMAMGESPSRLVIAGGVCMVALLAGSLLGTWNKPARTAPSTTIGAAQPAAMALEVHVAGFVANPGVVTVPEGAIVADAISAAGGLLASADPDAVNLAAQISQGQQIVIPGLSAGGGQPASTGDGLISLNHGSESDLEELPGVGPVLAGRIVAHRESHGPFEAVEDLLQVPGIGEAKLASMRDLVRP